MSCGLYNVHQHHQIYTKFLKAQDDVWLSGLTGLYSRPWTSRTVPLDWQAGVVVPLLKKGNQRACCNYRVLTLLCRRGSVVSVLALDQDQDQPEGALDLIPLHQ